MFDYLTQVPDYLSAEFVEEIASLMAAVIYMISVYPVRIKEKLVASLDFVETPFYVLLGPITLRVETLIFICKRMPAYSAKVGKDFFSDNRNIDMPESISVRRNNCNNMC